MPEQSLPQGHILGIDFGLRRIGIAVGQALTRTASALEIVRHGDQPDWTAFDRLVKEWNPALFVVGLPLAKDGEDTDMSKRARRFGAQLQGRYNRPVEFADERMTSRAAQSRFVEQRAAGTLRRKHASQLDAIAAKIILENWLQSQP